MCKSVPNSAIFCQKATEYGTKSPFFATDFVRTGRPCGSGLSQRAPKTNWPARPKASRERLSCMPAGGHRSSRELRWLITDMVQLRKLIGGIVANFPLAFCHFGVKPLLQTNGLLGSLSDFGRFFGYQILPNFSNFCQKRVAKGVRTGSKRQSTGGFSRPILLKRVKSGGSCQAGSGFGVRDSQGKIGVGICSSNPEPRVSNPV